MAVIAVVVHGGGGGIKPMAPMAAVSLLLNLEAARQGRSVLFSDEQKLLFEGWKKGFVNSLPAKSVLAGTKLVLFGRYVLKFYVGIVQ